ncbi:MAG: hypothetical protein NT069_33795 [Planctomycetota bacterium]|nr:hypothetical protein [Planctomycetota bacterium]
MSAVPVTTREEEARRDLGATQISPRLARGLCFGFLLAIVLVGLLELWQAKVDGAIDKARADQLEQRGALSELCRPAQRWLSRSVGMTTAGVIPGRGDWLYFDRDLAHLTGPAVLDSTRLDHRRLAEPGIEPDPLPAIIDLHQQLRRRGIRLIVVPVPSKGTIDRHPLYANQEIAVLPENGSFREILARLAAADVETVDVASLLDTDDRKTFVPRFLATDSHWNPSAVDLVARHLARRLGWDVSTGEFEETVTTIEGVGDLARRLDPAGTWRESVEIRPVTPLWKWNAIESASRRESQGAPIVLLGDSYTNIYSDPGLNFGENAGLTERLASHSQTQVDAIALNAGGAVASRREFARAWRRNPERFTNLKVVIWEFAVRELSFGDWSRVELPPSISIGSNAGQARAADVESASDPVTMTLTIRDIAPGDTLNGSAPYPEALLAVRCESEQGDARHPEFADVVVYVWGLRDRRPTPATRWKVGDAVELRLVPWSSVEGKLGRLARVELEDLDDDVLSLPVYLGEFVENGGSR